MRVLIEDKVLIAVYKYMDLRIKGFGAELSEEEIKIHQNMSEEMNNALFKAIVDLGGILPEGLCVKKEISEESRILAEVFKGMWAHGHEWAVEQVKKRLG